MCGSPGCSFFLVFLARLARRRFDATARARLKGRGARAGPQALARSLRRALYAAYDDVNSSHAAWSFLSSASSIDMLLALSDAKMSECDALTCASQAFSYSMTCATSTLS